MAESERRSAAADFVSIETPAGGPHFDFTQLRLGDETVLAFALKDQEVAEYHYRFYHLLATLDGRSLDRRSGSELTAASCATS